MNDFNIEHAVKYVKTLVDNCRCITCDQLNGPSVRYPCGHSVCNNCVVTAEDCLLCLSPPKISNNFIDEPLSQRIKHVSSLLITFEDLFKLDVNKRHRLSEQLKLEKQLFPECIQAPSKYCNKRKSTTIKKKDKENLKVSFLPGESISSTLKMENTFNYVEQWLNKNEPNTRKSNTDLPRKPFTDLNVNGQNFTKDHNLIAKDKNTRVSSRKRTHLKIFDTNVKETLRPKKKKKESFAELRSLRNKENKSFQKSICKNDESGIFVDEESIVIDDSQSENIDKDKLALLAVKEAERLTSCDNIHCNQLEKEIKFNCVSKLSSPNHFEIINSSLYKIPFYKKSLLYKMCEQTSERNMLQNIDNPKNVTVTIDNNNFLTTIMFTNWSQNNVQIVNKQSVAIQTDADQVKSYTTNCLSEYRAGLKNIDEIICSNTHQYNIKNDDLSNGDKNSTIGDQKNDNHSKVTNDTKNPSSAKRVKCLVIEDSDTDSDINEKENTLEVTAEVHRSEVFDNHGVLSSLEPNEYKNRMRPIVRAHTPLSTDSSDKENYDPNRVKRQKFGKKNCSKK